MLSFPDSAAGTDTRDVGCNVIAVFERLEGAEASAVIVVEN